MAIKVQGQIVIDDNQNIISSGIATATNFKTGTTNVHNSGIEVSGINVLGADTPIGSNATIFDDGNATFGGNVEALSLSISGVPVNTSTQVDEKITGLETSLTDLIATKSNTSSLATVATTGSYNNLINKPTLGTAAATASSAYATAAQGAKADTALQASNLVPYDTSAQVTAKIAALETSLTDGAPGALNTLNELAASLGDDANFASTITNLIATKADASSLATVATSGSYSDLSGKPSIPTHTSHITNNSGYITNSGGTTGATANTVVKRDSGADINCRLLRPNYQNQSEISGAIAFRVNNSSDNYVRFCSSPSAVRTWLGAGTSSFDGNYNSLSNKPSLFDGNYNSLSNRPSIPTHTSHLTNNSGYITSADGGNAATLDGIDSSQFLRSDADDNTTGKLLIGGTYGNNAYNSVSSTRLLFGGGNDPNNYFIGTNLENYNGTYSKLDLRWHTGIRIGAQPTYGGTRIYDSEDLTTLLFSVGRGDGHTRVESGNLYVQGNLAWHSGNDGSGSGLDADKLDGIDSSQFLRSDTNDTITKGSTWVLNQNISDWAVRFSNGNGTNANIYMCHGTHGMHIRNDSSTTSTYLLDVYAANGNRFQVRGADAYTTINGHQVWHAGNDGSGSGLDADTVDGVHASQFLTSIPSTVVQYNSYGNVNISGIVQGKSFRCRAGENGAVKNTFNIEWSPGRHGRLWIGTSDVGQLYLSSDYRLKRNIAPMSDGALNRIKMISPVSYQWNDFEMNGVELSTKSEEINEGFIAHELQQIIPSAVDGEKDDPVTIQSLKPDAIIAVAVKAIQELSAKNDALEARIAQLESN